MSEIALRVEKLGKRYRIGKPQKRHNTLRDAIASAFKRAETATRAQRPNGEDTIWALRDVGFEVKQGETVGIIGRNGAGKTTLLKILSRITEPTEGLAEIYGRCASLLEVGTGFHPELTGRENIYLNGAILGMRSAEIDRKFDEIVTFAEVQKFIDTPVKHYSSGMYVRLAFGVAAHLEPEILLVDEVLAVGDAAFQKKCLRKMGDVAKQGRTVLFVSHNMGAIQALCSRAIWIDRGKLVVDGNARQVVGEYIDAVGESALSKSTQSHPTGEALTIEQVVLRNEDGKATTCFRFGENITVEIYYNALTSIPKPYFWISIDSQFGSLFAANMLFDDLRPDFIQGSGVIKCIFKNVWLLPQSFTVWLGARDHTAVRNLIRPAEVAFFRVMGTARDLNFPGEFADSLLDSSTPMLVPYEWHLSEGQAFTPPWEKGGDTQ